MFDSDLSIGIHRGPDTLTVSFAGLLDARGSEHLRSTIEQTLNVSRTAPSHVLIDLRGCRGFELSGRGSLMEMHRLISSSCQRSAYVAERAHLRGCMQWVVHSLDDRWSRICMTVELADQWLAGQKDRLTDNHDQAAVAFRGLPRPTRTQAHPADKR